MNEAREVQNWRVRLITVARTVGWMAASMGLLVCVLCAFLFFNRSPGDFEGTVQMSAVHVVVFYGLPLLIVGSLTVWFAGRSCRSTSTYTSREPKGTP